MHEMMLAESLLQIIEDAAQKQGFRRVRTVWLEIGQLACVEPESLRFGFEAAARGSIAEDARVEIVRVAGQGWCRNCVRDFPLAALYDACPGCGGYDVRVSGRNGIRVKELEVE